MADTTPERRILTSKQVDDLGHAILALTRELWVVTDRVKTLECVLENHGIAARAEIEAYQPGDDEVSERMQHSQRMIQSVLGALGTGVSPGEQMAARSLKESAGRSSAS